LEDPNLGHRIRLIFFSPEFWPRPNLGQVGSKLKKK
jgi:hypothetical protein